MAHHGFKGSDEAFHLAEEGKIPDVRTSCDKAPASNLHNDVLCNNTAMVFIRCVRYGAWLTCAPEAIAMNTCDPGAPARIGIRQNFH